MKAEFKQKIIGETDIDSSVSTHPEWFVGAHTSDPRPGHVTYHTRHEVGVHTVHPDQGSDPARDGVVVVPRAFAAMYSGHDNEDSPYDFEAKRDAVIANVLGKTVVGVETPGYGMYASGKPNLPLIWNAAKGNLVPHARIQLEAVLAALKKEGIYDPKFERELELGFIGYSMGNIAVADMLGELEAMMPGAQVERLMFVEPVNDQKFGLFGQDGLMAAIGRETNDENTNRYLAQNARHDLAVAYDREESDGFAIRHLERAKRQKEVQDRAALVNGMIGAGMRKAWAPRVKPELARLGDVETDLIRADGSEVSRPKQTVQTALEFAEVTPLTTVTTLHAREGEPVHHHPFWHSLPIAAVLLHELESERASKR